MGVTPCTWEARIEAAAKRGSFDGNEWDHVQQCVDCRALIRVIELLGAEGRDAERQATQRMPSARAILAHARAAQSSADVRRVLRPILWVQRIVAALAVPLVMGVGWWLYMRAGDWLPHDLLQWTGDAHGPVTMVGTASASMVWFAGAILIVAWWGLVGLGWGNTRGR